jgi:UDP-N-acetylmuramoyl-L-alanyl-D-glutamate--2,6-diaminopimelate ligase
LALDRVLGTSFDTVVFTNLTQDHLDFHHSMEAYFEAKSKLFTTSFPTGSKSRKQMAIINLDDPYGVRLLGLATRETMTYGLNDGADLQGRAIRTTDSGTSFEMIYPGGRMQIQSPLFGIFNVYNMLAAAGTALHHDVSPEVIQQTLSRKIQVPGRLERVPGEYPVTVLVDYAHTEDALLSVLRTIQEFKKGKIIVVFGCGGDRDKGKRPKMGLVAGQFADYLYLTSDNPRSENPEMILKEIEEGVVASGTKKYRILVDRRAAIRAAIEDADPGDLILIAGKGHEEVQIIGSDHIEFSDREVAKAILTHRYGY